MAAATTTTAIRWCAAATGSCRWTCTCRAARPRPRRWSTASCSCRRRSTAPGPSCVAELDTYAVLPGVLGAAEEKGEIVLQAARDALPGLMRMLRDDPRFAFEQVMDICGVDYPQR